MWLKILPAVAAGLLGWWLGTNHVEGKWAKADNKALTIQRELTADALRDNRVLNLQVEGTLSQLAISEEEAQRAKDELQTEIDKAPLVNTVIPEVPANCPEIKCYVPDVERHFRLWNCGIGHSCQALHPAGQAGHSDAFVPGAGVTAGLDGSR